MKHHQYLLIGGGMTAASAVNGIREMDPAADIGMISAEIHPPYDRPPLSKHLWTGKRSIEDIWRAVPADVAFYPSRTVVELDPVEKQVVDRDGQIYRYDRLLLATGGRPRQLPFGDDRIIYFRTVDTYHRLKDLAQTYERFAVIGGGFIGSELAAALAMQGKQVTMLFPEAGIGARMFPRDLSAFLNDYYRDHGVEVLTGETAAGLEGEGTDLTLVTDQGRRLSVHGVVAGIGIQPSVELAQAAGLDGGGVRQSQARGASPAGPPRPACPPPAMWPTSPTHSWAGAVLNTKMQPTPWAGRLAWQWAALRRHTKIPPCITLTCLIWVTKLWASLTLGWRWWPSGRSSIAKAWSTILKTDGFAACCCGTSGGRSTQLANSWQIALRSPARR